MRSLSQPVRQKWCAPVIPAVQVNRRILVQVGLGKNLRPYLKITKAKRVRSVAKVVEHLHNKHEALSSSLQKRPQRIN
jgi:hypothetical protein